MVKIYELFKESKLQDPPTGYFYPRHVWKLYFHVTTLQNNDPGSLRES